MAEVLETEVAKGVLVGPLSTDKSPDELARNLFRLFRSLGIRNSEITKITVNPKIGYAKIGLFNVEIEEKVVAALKDYIKVMRAYDLKNIMDDPKALVVERVKEDVISSPPPLDKAAVGDKNILFLSQTKLAELEAAQSSEDINTPSNLSTTSSSTLTAPHQYVPLTAKSSRASAHGAVSGSELQPEYNIGSPVDTTVDRKTSTPFVVPCDCPETIFYHQLQYIGTETRHAEFKKGGVIHDQRAFREMISKYICGFLNSEGGTIYFGVDDEGKVLGKSIDEQLQKMLVRDIDFAIRLIEPSVPESEYSVNFACVMGASGEMTPNLKVLEVCVKPRQPTPTRRFTYDDVIYLKRDGSLQAVNKVSASGVNLAK